MMHLPSIVIVSFYFRRRRALATSVVLCGSGVGKFVFAPLFRYLIDKYGWRGANCIVAAVILHGAACGCVFRPIANCPSSSETRPRASPPRPASCVLMQKIIAEKRRRRRDSTGSLDGTLITSDGRLLRHSGQATSGLSSGRQRTISDPIATENQLRTFSITNEQLVGQHSATDQLNTSSELSAASPKTVSDPLSAGTTAVTVSVCYSSADRLNSATLSRTVSVDNRDSPRTFDDSDAIVPDAELIVEQSSPPSETSETSTVVWQLDRHSPSTLNFTRTQRSESEQCSSMIEMTDISQHRPPSLIHGPPNTSCRPPNVLAPLSSRPDIFYTGSYLQVRPVCSC